MDRTLFHRTLLALSVVSASSIDCSSSAKTLPLDAAGDGTGVQPPRDDGGRPRDATRSAADVTRPGETGRDASREPDGGGGAHDGVAPGTWWVPGTGTLPWQWELDHEIDTTSTEDMGTGDTTPSGANAAAPAVYDVDGFDSTAADVSALHALGKKVVCYVEVGAAEDYRPDYGQFAVADLGKTESGYPDEKYVDINSAAVLVIMKARVAMCAQKGFDGIEPDIDDSYTDDTGFTLTESDNVAYLETLSRYAHSLGIAWGLKNGGDGGDPTSFVADMLPYIDFAVVEEPFYLGTIGYFYPSLYDRGKALFVAEYTNDTSTSLEDGVQPTDYVEGLVLLVSPEAGLDGALDRHPSLKAMCEHALRRASRDQRLDNAARHRASIYLDALANVRMEE